MTHESICHVAIPLATIRSADLGILMAGWVNCATGVKKLDAFGSFIQSCCVVCSMILKRDQIAISGPCGSR